MKRYIFLILLLFGGTLAAQDTDGGATPILQSLAKKYQALTSMNIDYTYKAVKDKKTIATLTGEVAIKGKKYYMTFDDQTFYCDGTTMWNYQKSSNEVSIYTYDESDDDILNPAKMLGNWQKDYTAKFIREEVEAGKSLQIIDLTPKKGQSYYKIRLFIDKNKKEIVRCAVYEKDNTIYTYYFDKFVSNAAISDSQFVFDAAKHPGVETNDMR